MAYKLDAHCPTLYTTNLIYSRMKKNKYFCARKATEVLVKLAKKQVLVYSKACETWRPLPNFVKTSSVMNSEQWRSIVT